MRAAGVHDCHRRLWDGESPECSEGIGARRAAAEISRDPDRLAQADKIVLPGVGAFRDAMCELQRHGLGRAAAGSDRRATSRCSGSAWDCSCCSTSATKGKPAAGWASFPAKVVRFDLPRAVTRCRTWDGTTVTMRRRAPILEGLQDGDYFYFVHSYYVVPKRSGRGGTGDRLRRAVLLDDLARQSLRHAVSPGEEPGRGIACAGELCAPVSGRRARGGPSMGAIARPGWVVAMVLACGVCHT